MCGISFIVSKNSTGKIGALTKMNSLISHRGPDGEGLYVANGNTSIELNSTEFDNKKNNPELKEISDYGEQGFSVLLGHRRLSIIDLSYQGHQPMVKDDHRFVLTFNGEIYNYLELKEELLSLGYSFSTQSDTEVIIRAYEAWGEDCLTRFNGMFAFLLLDNKTNTLFGARDRFGIKPFYYGLDKNGDIYGGSEIKQIVNTISNNVEMNNSRVYDYLIWGQTDHTNETMFKGINQLESGHYFKLKYQETNKINPICYYDLNKRIKKYKGDYKSAVKEYKNLFESSIRLRLRSDVPVGTCLSGGLDSSSILSQIIHENKENKLGITTFSNCSTEKKYDEQEFIDCFSEYESVTQKKTFPSVEQLYEDLKEIIYYHDEPFLSTSVFAEWSVFKLVQEDGNVKVTLDGHGADEQLLGYHSFFPSLFGTFFRKGRFDQIISEMHYLNDLHGYKYKELLGKLFYSILPFRLTKWALKKTGRIDFRPKWLHLEGISSNELANNVVAENVQMKIEDMSILQIKKTSVPKQLKWNDRDSMRRSIESRVPFLDHNLVEFTLGLPLSYRYSKGWTKRVLRDALNGVLPDKIKNRTDKMGYVTPEEVWFRSKEGSELKDLVLDSIRSSDGILSMELMDDVNKIINGEKRFSKIIWRSICLGQWMKLNNIKANG